MKKRLKQKLTTWLGALVLVFGVGVSIYSYVKNETIDMTNSAIFLGVGIFLLFANDALFDELTLGVTTWIKKKLG